MPWYFEMVEVIMWIFTLLCAVFALRIIWDLLKGDKVDYEDTLIVEILMEETIKNSKNKTARPIVFIVFAFMTYTFAKYSNNSLHYLPSLALDNIDVVWNDFGIVSAIYNLLGFFILPYKTKES